MFTRLGARFCYGDYFASVWRGERVLSISLDKGKGMSEYALSGWRMVILCLADRSQRRLPSQDENWVSNPLEDLNQDF